VEKLRVLPEQMERNVRLMRGLIHSQQVLLKLTERGISREDGYRIVQRNAMRVWETDGDFKSLLAADPDVVAKLRPGDLDEVFDIRRHFRDVNRTFRVVGLG
jgi:adenylosuccinate lyase